jgi:AraC family transcriptional regulator, regulatory protein of adaptative response / methylated-DNA-[protein]-cysteine methyltransferase
VAHETLGNRTTGDYCRPSRGARPARPENVAFHLNAVVRTDGTLPGYRSGVERKRALLAREARS